MTPVTENGQHLLLKIGAIGLVTCVSGSLGVPELTT